MRSEIILRELSVRAARKRREKSAEFREKEKGKENLLRRFSCFCAFIALEVEGYFIF